ncbi:MAG: hypothetical protein QM791_07810 [Ferruginibacter sp.]
MQVSKISREKIKKFCRYAAITIVVGMIVLYFGGYWYFRNAYKFEYYDPSFVLAIAKDIKTTPKLPANFKNIESRINKERVTYKSQYKNYFCTNVFFISNDRPANFPGNFSKEVFEIQKKKHTRQYTWRLFVDESLVYSFGLEKEFGVESLNNFYYNNCEFQASIDSNKIISLHGIQAISKYKFDRPVDSLTTDQLIELYLLSGDKSRDHFLSDTIKYQARLKVLKSLYVNNF